MCVKLSILLFYLQVSPHRAFRAIVYVVITATVIYSVLGSFEFVFACKPVAKNWDLTLDGTCFPPLRVLSIHGGLNIATDVAMLALPVILVRKLRLPIRQKIALAALFMTGTMQAPLTCFYWSNTLTFGSVCIVSIVRLQKVLIAASAEDTTWLACDVIIWT
jgi:hypothetical protein